MLKIAIRLRKYILFRPISKLIFLIIGIDIPNQVELGKNVVFPHNSVGTVIHPNTKIGNGVKIYQNVTIGRSDIYNEFNNSNMSNTIIKDNVIICAGAKILSKEKEFIIGENSIVAANAVLLNSIGSNEIWAGVPAKKIGYINKKREK